MVMAAYLCGADRAEEEAGRYAAGYLLEGRLSSPFSLSISATSSMCRQSHMHAPVLAFWTGAMLPLQ
jgi:hypothetical protein